MFKDGEKLSRGMVKIQILLIKPIGIGPDIIQFEKVNLSQSIGS
jgi:hypothetical protein